MLLRLKNNKRFIWLFKILSLNLEDFKYFFKFYSMFFQKFNNSITFFNFSKSKINFPFYFKKFVFNINRENVKLDFENLHIFYTFSYIPVFFFQKKSIFYRFKIKKKNPNPTLLQKFIYRFNYSKNTIFLKFNISFNNFFTKIKSLFLAQWKIYKFIDFFNDFFWYFNISILFTTKKNFFMFDYCMYNLNFLSKKRNFFINITEWNSTLSDEFFEQGEIFSQWTTGIIRVMLNLSKGLKGSKVCKIFLIKHLRRVMLSVNLLSFSIILKKGVFDFSFFWNILNRPLQEIFFISSDIFICDLEFKSKKNIFLNLENFKNDLFQLNNKLKYTNSEETVVWKTFISEFSSMLKTVNFLGNKYYVRYLFNCLGIIAKNSVLKKTQKSRKYRSIRKRFTKLIIKAAKRRVWIF